jgi:hypothetical protein
LVTLIVIAATGGQAFTFAKKATTRIDARSATAPFVQLLRPNSSIGSVVRFDDDLGDETKEQRHARHVSTWVGRRQY